MRPCSAARSACRRWAARWNCRSRKTPPQAALFASRARGCRRAGGTGDLFATAKIILPDGNDSELEQLMEKWREGHPYNRAATSADLILCNRTNFFETGQSVRTYYVAWKTFFCTGVVKNPGKIALSARPPQGCGLERGTSAVPNPDRGRLRRSADRAQPQLLVIMRCFNETHR